MKVGGLELQGLEAWQSQLIVGIHFPIMAVVLFFLSFSPPPKGIFCFAKKKGFTSPRSTTKGSV